MAQTSPINIATRNGRLGLHRAGLRRSAESRPKRKARTPRTVNAAKLLKSSCRPIWWPIGSDRIPNISCPRFGTRPKYRTAASAATSSEGTNGRRQLCQLNPLLIVTSEAAILTASQASAGQRGLVAQGTGGEGGGSRPGSGPYWVGRMTARRSGRCPGRQAGCVTVQRRSATCPFFRPGSNPRTHRPRGKCHRSRCAVLPAME